MFVIVGAASRKCAKWLVTFDVDPGSNHGICFRYEAVSITS